MYTLQVSPPDLSGVKGIKLEGKSVGEIMADKIEAIKATSEQHIARLRTVNLDARTFKEKAEKQQRDTGKLQHVIFIADCEKCDRLTGQVARVLERLCIKGEEGSADKLPKLVKTMEQIDSLMEDIESWASKFGFRVGGSPDDKKRKRVKTSSS